MLLSLQQGIQHLLSKPQPQMRMMLVLLHVLSVGVHSKFDLQIHQLLLITGLPIIIFGFEIISSLIIISFFKHNDGATCRKSAMQPTLQNYQF